MRMTERAKDAAAETNLSFMQRLSDAIDTHKEGQKDPEEPWDEHDYEKFMKECDYAHGTSMEGAAGQIRRFGGGRTIKLRKKWLGGAN